MTQRQTSPTTTPNTDRSTPADTARTVAVFGACHAPEGSTRYAFAYELGQQLGQAGIEVLNGGYDGTMEASSRGARENGVRTIGITCPSVVKTFRGPVAPNPYLEIALPTPNLTARINAMMQLSGGYVALDGGTGTLAELAIIWEYVSKGLIAPRPIVLASPSWTCLTEPLRNYRQSSTTYVHSADTPEQVVAILQEHTVPGTFEANVQAHATGLNDASTTVAELSQIMNDFVTEREWLPFHNPKNLSASIAIEAAELMEHFQWLRTDELNKLHDNPQKMTGIKEEIADVLAYVLSFARTMNIDLASALAEKMEKNAVKYPADQFKGNYE
jgi:uncharacterized protein (TIGR00725 family)